MIPALGAGGHGFDSRITPVLPFWPHRLSLRISVPLLFPSLFEASPVLTLCADRVQCCDHGATLTTRSG